MPVYTGNDSNLKKNNNNVRPEYLSVGVHKSSGEVLTNKFISCSFSLLHRSLTDISFVTTFQQLHVNH